VVLPGNKKGAFFPPRFFQLQVIKEDMLGQSWPKILYHLEWWFQKAATWNHGMGEHSGKWLPKKKKKEEGAVMVLGGQTWQSTTTNNLSKKTSSP
jgi:hypothetical protein